MDTPTSSLTPQLNQPESVAESSYLRFQLNKDTSAVLPMKYVQEVFMISTGQITPIPNMPECVLGLLNRRNRILWAVDLALMLTLQPIDTSSQQYHVMIIRVGETPLSLLVREVKGVTRLTSVHPIDGENNAIGLSYLCGYLWYHQQQLFVLDAEAIIHSPSLYSY